MDAKKTSMKTLIGLPIVLVVASGIAYGAARLSEHISLQSADTLTAEESDSAMNDPLNTDEALTNETQVHTNSSTNSTKTSTDYEVLLGEFSLALAAHDRDWNLRPGQPAITAAELEPLAASMIQAICWMRTADPQADKIPPGPLRTEFQRLLATYQDDPKEVAACLTLSADQMRLGQIGYDLDDDKDGLNTPAETWYATDYFNADTDGDGFSDLEEITNGYSPLKAE